MIEQYNLTPPVYQKLIKTVPVIELIRHTSIFSPNQEPVTYVCLMLIVDKYGDFIDESDGSYVHKISKAVYECLPADEQMAILRYINRED